MLEKLRQIKDMGLSAALRMALNEKFSRYGRISNLRLDTSAHRLLVDVLLEGESEETTLAVEEYELLRDGDAAVIRLGKITASRAWLEQAMNDAADRMLQERRLRVEHPAIAKVLKAVL